MGYFYPPPPTFIGGRQPYAPPLGQIQSGPLPQAPPLRGAFALATLGVILSTWQTPFFEAQGAGDIAPLLPPTPVVSQPPARSNATQAIIQSCWVADSTTLIPLCSIAPFVAAAIAGQPPQPLPINLQTILQAWQPAFFEAQGAGDIAPTLPIVNTAPVRSFVNLSTVLQAWIPPFLESQGASDIAPLLPAPIAPSQPPVQSYATLYGILNAWIPPTLPSQGFTWIAPSLPAPPVISQPPVLTRVTQRLILDAWLPAFLEPQGYGDIAPLVPGQVVAVQPSVGNGALLRSILAQWTPSPYSIPLAGNLAPFIPPPIPPSQPQPRSYATMLLTVQINQPLPWWPLPHLTLSIPPNPPPQITLTPGARYTIARIRARQWMISCNTYSQFGTKAPDEDVKLTFDFTRDLPAGITLTGLPTTTYAVETGLDANPGALANGSAGTDVTQKMVVVPVQGGVDGVTYKIHALCATTDPDIMLSLTGYLSVAA